MTNSSNTFNRSSFERELDQSLTRLRTPALHELPLDDRRSTAETTEQQTIGPLRRQLEVEWQRRLLIERGAVSRTAGLSAAERQQQERDLLAAALRDLLPLAAKLIEAEALLDQLRGQPPRTTPLGSAALDQGLQALAQADLPKALRRWALAGPVEDVVQEVQARREQQAQQLLKQAAAVFSRLPDLKTEQERSDLRTSLRREYIEPVRRIGTEQQREKAQQINTAVEAALTSAAMPATVEQPVPPASATPAPPAEQRQRRRLWLWAVIGAVLAALVFVLLQPGNAADDPVIADASAAPAADASVISAGTSAQPSVESAPTPSATVAPTATSEPTATPDAPTTTPTLGSVISTTAIDPPEVFAGNLPIEWRVRGTGLDQVQSAQLVPERGAPIALEIVPGTSDELTLRLTALPEPITGAISSLLYLNGSPQETLPIILRDFQAAKPVQGVKAEYSYTGRIKTDGLGPYTTLHETSDATTAALAPLRNGEQIEILRSDVVGWYQARIRVSNDPAQIGKVGWIERWLIDDQNVPIALNVGPPAGAAPAAPAPTAAPRPTPRPAPTARPRPTARPQPPAARKRVFGAAVARSYPGTGSSGTRQSCVEGRVLDRGGGGVGAAVINVNNGVASVDRQTNGSGEFQICGLGDSIWSVVLVYVPGEPGLARQATGTVYVNGGADQVAVVNFREQ